MPLSQCLNTGYICIQLIPIRIDFLVKHLKKITLFHNNQNCWIQFIYLILKELNLLYNFHKPFSLTNKTLLKQKLKHRFERYWLADINNNKGKSSDMNSGNKLRTYATFKCQFSCESYIEALKFRERQALSKFRTSAHKLEIEKCRYTVLKTLSVTVYVSNVVMG